MYPGSYAKRHPNRPAIIIAGTGEAVSYQEFEARSNRLAHLLRDHGLKRLDHFSIFMENNNRYLECCGAGERSGLYYTCINHYLKGEELAYILNNSESRILIVSNAKLGVAIDALADCPNISLCLVTGIAPDALSKRTQAAGTNGIAFRAFEEAVSAYPDTPIADEYLGTSMLYSSGTTGRPKGILRPLAETAPDDTSPIYQFIAQLWKYREDMIYLSPAPLYHSAPQAAVGLTLRLGGTAIIMESFDPESYLNYVGKYKPSHSQLVPTMFSRMLKLPKETRDKADLSSLEVVTHAAAPCPVKVKEEMIEWWGPIINEYYGATEGLGFAALDSHEWLENRGSVGKIIYGDLHILDEQGNPCPEGEPGELWFKSPDEFTYFNNAEKTNESTSADGTMNTVGDVGYVKNGYLYLTDRATFMIISGGVNIYPQETEDLLITHPKVADAAVFGVPNVDLGEEVKAVVQPLAGIAPSPELAADLMAFCAENLSRQKCPRSIEFDAELPRLPTGKLYKRQLKDRYWEDHETGIL